MCNMFKTCEDLRKFKVFLQFQLTYLKYRSFTLKEPPCNKLTK